MPSERLRFRDAWFVKAGAAIIVSAVVPFIVLFLVSLVFNLKDGAGGVGLLLFVLGTFVGLILVVLGMIGTIVQNASRSNHTNDY
jgi:hypothetical protein